MKLKLVKLPKGGFVSNSLVMLIGTNVANVFAYFYHLYFGRVLGAEDYGKLAAAFSILTIVLSLFSFMSLFIIKFVASSNKDDTRSFYRWAEKKVVLLALFVTTAIILFSSFIANFLFIERRLVLYVAITSLFAIMVILYSSVLHGLLRFKKSVMLNNLGWFLRFIFGVIFYYLDFDLPGVIVGILIANIIITLLGYYLLKDVRSRVTAKFVLKKEMVLYAFSVLVMGISANSLVSSDLLLVKHYLTDFEAGIYASLSTLGKIILYGAIPITYVVFPMSAKLHAKEQKSGSLFFMGLAIVMAVCTVITLLYLFSPAFIVEMLFGKGYLSAAEYLFGFAVFISFYTLNIYSVNFLLSKNKTLPSFFLLAAAVLQIVGVYFYHNDLSSVITVSLIINAILFGVIILYFFTTFNARAYINSKVGIIKNNEA